jgi:uncharacterized membrane protein
MSGTASLFSHFVSTRGTFRWLLRLVIFSSATAWVVVGFNIAQIRLLTRQEMGLATAVEKAAHGVTGEVLGKIQMVLLAATFIAFVTWLYRARANLRAFGTRRLRYPRNWTIFGFLIPVLNLVRPYQVIREVWQASDPSATRPTDWKTVKPSPLLQAWWGAVVVFFVLRVLASWMVWSSFYDLTRLRIAHGVLLLADVMAAVSVTLLYFVVDHITEAQQVKWERLSPPPGAEPPGTAAEPGKTPLDPSAAV